MMTGQYIFQDVTPRRSSSSHSRQKHLPQLDMNSPISSLIRTIGMPYNKSLVVPTLTTKTTTLVRPRQYQEAWAMMLMMETTPGTMGATVSTSATAMTIAPVSMNEASPKSVPRLPILCLALLQHATTASSYLPPTTGCTSTCDDTARAARYIATTAQTTSTTTRAIAGRCLRRISNMDKDRSHILQRTPTLSTGTCTMT